jgi:hypothetical protein
VPQPMIGPQQRASLSTASRHRATSASVGGTVLSTPRSPRYIRALRKLDTSMQLTPAALTEVVDDIKREFEEKWAAEPIGIVSRCHLGAPYEVHTLTTTGEIIEHYRVGQALPGALERARELARTDNFLCVEVYGDRLVAILPDGSTGTVEDQHGT